MKKAMSPRLMMILSMAIFGTLGLFVRNIPVSSGELALYRAVLAALLIAGDLLLTGQKIPLAKNRREVPFLLLSGVAMGINWILLFEAYRYTTVSLATLSYYFAPVIVTLVCPLLFHEKLTGKQLLCFAMSTLGLVMITGTGSLGGGTDLIGILFGLGAAAFYATVILLNKFIKNVECLDPVRAADRRHYAGQPEPNRLDQPAHGRPAPYGDHLLYVFFFPQGTAGAKGGHSQLY